MLPLHPTVVFAKESADGLIALNKPNGILSHPNSAADKNISVLHADYSEKERCYRWRNHDGSIGKCYLINRLDSATSGIILLSRHETVAQQAIDAFEKLLVKKTYYALLFGFIPETAVWKESLNIEKQNGKLRVRKGTQFHAVTDCKRIYSKPYGQTVISLAELSPKTGRTHQLRCHSAIHNAPIVGDQTYGNFSLNRKIVQEFNEKRLFLHSAKIEIKLPSSTVLFKAEAPLPESFSRILGKTDYEIFNPNRSSKTKNSISRKQGEKTDKLLEELRKKYNRK